MKTSFHIHDMTSNRRTYLGERSTFAGKTEWMARDVAEALFDRRNRIPAGAAAPLMSLATAEMRRGR